jgi:Golgi nucleoside diphosphatase
MFVCTVNANSVSILDDRDEGLYAWYTVNFLLSKLHDIKTSIVTLDLGGGSTQITFATNNTETLVCLGIQEIFFVISVYYNSIICYDL